MSKFSNNKNLPSDKRKDYSYQNTDCKSIKIDKFMELQYI